jgi:hypothetical protein
MGNAMSLFSLASVAVARDLAAPGQPVANHATVSKMLAAALGAGTVHPSPDGQAAVLPAAPAAGQPAGPAAATAGTVAGFAQLLVAQIPSEALLAYTTLLALFSTGGISYNTGRWGLYAAAIIACAAAVLGGYLAQRNYGFDDTQTGPAPGTGSTPAAADAPDPAQTAAPGNLHLPYLPVLAAVSAMAVYGLTVPGSPLQFEVSRTAFAIVSGCLAVGGGVMMSIFAPFLGKGNAAIPVANQPGNPPRPQPPAKGQTDGTTTPPALVQESETMVITPTDESDVESVARRALPESATDQEVAEPVSAIHEANPGPNLDQIQPGIAIVVPTTATPAQAVSVAANTVQAQLVSQIETAIGSLGSNLPASVSAEWKEQLQSLMGQP